MVDTAAGRRARDPASGRVIHPGPVWEHLQRAFGAVLPAVHGAMTLLAAALTKETLADGTVPYTLYANAQYLQRAAHSRCHITSYKLPLFDICFKASYHVSFVCVCGRYDMLQKGTLFGVFPMFVPSLSW